MMSSQLLLYYSGFPGIVFRGAPILNHITPQGAIIDMRDSGIFLSIPERATKKNVDLLIHPCFNGPFELPARYELASPAYLIQPRRKVAIQKDATLQIHHCVSLQNKKGLQKMRFLSASPTPLYRQSKPVYIFQKIKQSKGVFPQDTQIGEIVARHFCFVCIGIKRNSL